MHDQPGGQELPRRDPRCTQRFLDNLSCVQALWAPVGTTPCLGLSRVLLAVSGVRPGREGAREAQMSGWATYSGYQRTWAGGSELWALGKLGSGAGHPPLSPAHVPGHHRTKLSEEFWSWPSPSSLLPPVALFLHLSTGDPRRPRTQRPQCRAPDAWSSRPCPPARVRIQHWKPKLLWECLPFVLESPPTVQQF